MGEAYVIEGDSVCVLASLALELAVVSLAMDVPDASSGSMKWWDIAAVYYSVLFGAAICER